MLKTWKMKVLGLGPDLMKLNSQQLQSQEKQLLLRKNNCEISGSSQLWNGTLVTVKSSSFTCLTQKTVSKYLTERRSIKVCVPSLVLSILASLPFASLASVPLFVFLFANYIVYIVIIFIFTVANKIIKPNCKLANFTKFQLFAMNEI